jgi:hypothetical protein
VIDFIASDGNSADTEMVTITVNEINNVPSARDTLLATLEDIAIIDSLPASDPDSDPLLYEVISGPFNGSFTTFDENTGVFEYQPDNNQHGVDSFLFRVDDGISLSNDATVSLTIAPVNDPPQAGDLAVTVLKNSPYDFGAMPVSDVDDASWIVGHTSGPFNGNVTNFDPGDGSFTYTPNFNFEGEDSIKYEAHDGVDPSNTGTLRISVVVGCNCPYQSDLDGDGFVTPIDLGEVIDILFAGAPDIQDGSCPRARADFDCDGFSTALDLSALIDHLFVSGPEPCDPCAP